MQPISDRSYWRKSAEAVSSTETSAKIAAVGCHALAVRDAESAYVSDASIALVSANVSVSSSRALFIGASIYGLIYVLVYARPYIVAPIYIHTTCTKVPRSYKARASMMF